MAHLFELTDEFDRYLSSDVGESSGLADLVSVNSFDYKHAVLEYGQSELNYDRV